MRQTRIQEKLKSLLPIIKTWEVNSTPPVNIYMLRLTPMDKYEDEDVILLLEAISVTYLPIVQETSKRGYLVAKEVSKKCKTHYHAIIFTDIDRDEENVRNIIRVWLAEHFPGDPKRGDANKQYNLQLSNNYERAIQYILKDGDIIKYSSNVNVEILNKLKDKSYKKFSKDEFAAALEILKEKFKADDPPLDEMMIELSKLKAIYRQPTNHTQLYNMCVSFSVHNNPSRAGVYVRKFLSRLE